jgi:hypothetical protein
MRFSMIKDMREINYVWGLQKTTNNQTKVYNTLESLLLPKKANVKSLIVIISCIKKEVSNHVKISYFQVL